MDNTMQKSKGILITAFASLTAWLGWLAVPLGLLVLCNLLDYGTGLAAAPYRNQKRNSRRGFAGIAKKIGMWLLVGVGVVVDLLASYLVQTMGIQLAVHFPVGCVVCLWLLVNELISIVENIADLGVEVPFLLPVIGWLKKKTEDIADEFITPKK